MLKGTRWNTKSVSSPRNNSILNRRRWLVVTVSFLVVIAYSLVPRATWEEEKLGTRLHSTVLEASPRFNSFQWRPPFSFHLCFIHQTCASIYESSLHKNQYSLTTPSLLWSTAKNLSPWSTVTLGQTCVAAGNKNMVYGQINHTFWYSTWKQITLIFFCLQTQVDWRFINTLEGYKCTVTSNLGSTASCKLEQI